MARARIQEASARKGIEFFAARVDTMRDALRGNRPSLLILDLDTGREDVLKELVAARDDGIAPDRVIGYFSHVDRELGDAARRAGCDVRPRGAFWSTLDALFTPAPGNEGA